VLMPPHPVTSRPVGFTHLSQAILEENTDDSVLAHTKGRERNLLVGTQI
jgi:hypothetical protein